MVPTSRPRANWHAIGRLFSSDCIPTSTEVNTLAHISTPSIVNFSSNLLPHVRNNLSGEVHNTKSVFRGGHATRLQTHPGFRGFTESVERTGQIKLWELHLAAPPQTRVVRLGDETVRRVSFRFCRIMMICDRILVPQTPLIYTPSARRPA
jgi:hypothetical protein